MIFKERIWTVMRFSNFHKMKLTTAEIAVIMRDERSAEEIADDYGVSATTIRKYKKRTAVYKKGKRNE